jgi:site-specific DNA recombinase
MEPGKASSRRCAIYTRKSSEEGLEQDFNSLHAQREACESYIKSQQGEGWRLVKTAYDDGGLSGATINRPALQRLLCDIRERLIDVVVVYKVDRLTRSLSPRWSKSLTLKGCRLWRSPSSSIPPLRCGV